MDAASLADTFNATSREFDAVTPLVWGPAGQSLTFALGLRSGDAVLDVCSGTGASALPAAAAVGPDGLVHAIDLADDLLEVGRVNATERALRNIDFVVADATAWEPPSTVPDAGYDALACSYGIFFLPDPERDFSRLVSLVRPGGGVGVTVWRQGAIEAFSRAYFEVIAAQFSVHGAGGPPRAGGVRQAPDPADGDGRSAGRMARGGGYDGRPGGRAEQSCTRHGVVRVELRVGQCSARCPHPVRRRSRRADSSGLVRVADRARHRFDRSRDTGGNRVASALRELPP
nr:class I SAM-dependent methyltransferase [Rhodococcus fascians]